MAGTIQTVKLNSRVKNDTFESIEFAFKDGLAAAIDITGWSFECQFRIKSKTGKVIKTLSIGAGMTITDGPNGLVEIDAFILTWPADEYYYDISADTGTKLKTYIQGTMVVLQDTTY
jgi:hypothetical protein